MNRMNRRRDADPGVEMLEATIRGFAAAVARGDLADAELRCRGAFAVAIIDPETARAVGADPPRPPSRRRS